MNRSEINAAIRQAEEAFAGHLIDLPTFANWTPDQWAEAAPAAPRVRSNGLGWDVTDFGTGDFPKHGAVLFTLRNGNHEHPESGTPYAEKLIVLLPGQRLPLHFHYSKTEDITNRGGGVLVIKVYNALPDDSVDEASPIEVYCDAIKRTPPPGREFDLYPGESITLTSRLYHQFWAKPDAGTLICGEVSTVNDDNTDNHFAEPISRFPQIEEDCAPYRLLCNEYPAS